MSCQAGMNGAGLGFGLTSVPEVRLNPHPDRMFSDVADGGLYYKILKQCATVDEALELAQNYELERMSYQILLADANGDAATISPGADGELSFLRKGETEKYLAASSFNLAAPMRKTRSDNFKRYETVQYMLGKLERDRDATVSFCTSVLSGVRRERGVYFGSYTVYSSVFDLKTRTAHLYFLSRFHEAVELNLSKELARGEHFIRLADMISTKTRDEALTGYRSVQTKSLIVLVVSGIGALLTLFLLGLAVMRVVRRLKRKTAQL